MKCIQVLPILKHTFSEELTYWTAQDFAVGDMIEVELNHRSIYAIVSSIISLSEAKEFIKSRDFKIKKIESYTKIDFFSNEFIRSCLQTSKYFMHPFGEILSEYIPKKVLHELKSSSVVERKSIQTDSLTPIYIQNTFEERVEYIRNLQNTYAYICVVVPTDAHKKHLQKALFETQESDKIRVITPIDLYIFDITFVDMCVLEYAGSEYYRHVRKNFDTRHTIRTYCSLRKVQLVEMDSILPMYVESSPTKHSNFNTPISNTPEIHVVDQTISNSAHVKKTTYSNKKSLPQPADEADVRVFMEGDIDVVTHKKLKLISPELYSLITYAEKKKEDIFIYTTRKGLSSSITCSDCGYTLVCSICQKPYTLKNIKGVRTFACPYSHEPLPTDTPCPVCGNMHMRLLGSGTDALEAELSETISMPIVIVDGDHMTQSGARAVFKKRKEKEHAPTIYIGTELALHQSLSEKFAYTAIASLETLLSLPSRIAELESARVVETLRAKTTDTLVIQTRNPTHIVWKCIHEKNWKELLERVQSDVKELSLPPYSTHIQIQIFARHKTAAADIAAIYAYIKDFKYISLTHIHDTMSETIHLYIEEWPFDPIYRYLKSFPPHVHIQVDSPSLM